MSNKIKVPIRGLHCASCEILTEDKLSKITGVKKVKVSQLAGEAVIEYDGEAPDMEQINQGIMALGYELGEDNKLWFSRDHETHYYFLVSLAVILGLYFLANLFGLSDLSWFKPSGNFSWPLVLIIGLTAGFSTCMAIVGGMVLAIGANFTKAHPNLSFRKKLIPSLTFTIGRVGGYFLLGGILGMLGQRFKISATVNGLITLLVGLVLLFLGLKLIKLFPRLNSWQLTLPKALAKSLGLNKTKDTYSHWGTVTLGALTFFTPCGFTQAMQLYALGSGNFWTGAAIMGLFAIGTAPGILSLGSLASAIKGKISNFLFTLVGMGLIFFSIFNLANGYKLLSLSNSWSWLTAPKSTSSNLAGVEMKDGQQIIRMTQSSRGYSPNKFKLIKDVPVKWIITSTAPNSCASSLIVPKFNIEKQLESGENIIEFTPKELGKIGFSCSMGMYTGSFEVVDGKDSSASNNSGIVEGVKASNNDAPTVDANAGNASCNVPSTGAETGGGCGGGSGGCGGGSGGCGCGSGGGCGGQAKPVVEKVGTVASSVTAPKTPVKTASAPVTPKIKVFKTTYTTQADIQPNTFTVKVGDRVRLEVYVQDEGRGCMSSILIPGLVNTAQHLAQGQTIIMEFTAERAGRYLITCAMNVPRGKIIIE